MNLNSTPSKNVNIVLNYEIHVFEKSNIITKIMKILRPFSCGKQVGKNPEAN